jgi:fluoride exporter
VRIFLLVVFGAVGTLARYGLQGVVQHRVSSTFPAGTLTVNLLGCFLLGGVAQYGFNHLTIPPEWRIAITVGFFGAFTTFYSFSYETVRMFEDGEWSSAALYVGVSLVGGLLAVMLGIRLADLL